MKRLFLFIAYLSLLVATAAPVNAQTGLLKYFLFEPAQKKAHVVITTGQSNEQSGEYPDGEGSTPLGWLNSQPRILIKTFGTYTTGYQYPGTFEPMLVNVNTMGMAGFNGYAPGVKHGYWGPEQAFVHDLLNVIPPNDIVAVVKVTEGGLDLSYWEAGGRMRAQLDDQIPAAITWLEAAGYEVVIHVVLWGQGEGNAGEATSSVQPRYVAVFNHIRGIDTRLTNTKFILRKLGSVQTFYTSGQRATVNTAFDNIALADNRYLLVDPNNVPGIATDAGLHIHYLADSKLGLGHEAFNVWYANGGL